MNFFVGNEGNYDHERNFIHEYDLNNLVFFNLRGVFTAGGIFYVTYVNCNA